MLKMTIDNEEVVSDKDITINEEMLSASSTILNNVYPKEWEEDKDYTSRFYYPQDYSKALIQRSYVTQEAEAGTTIQVNGSVTLTDVDTNKNSRVLRLLGQTSQTGTPTPSSPIPINVVSGDNEINVVGKNLLRYDLAHLKGKNTTGTWNNNVYTSNGLTITINKDLSIKINGTSTAQETFFINNEKIYFETGTYYLSGSVNGSNTTYDIRVYNFNGSSIAFQCLTGAKEVPFVNNNQFFNVAIVVRNGQTLNNVVFYPMIAKTNDTTYEPYNGDTYNIDLPVENLCDVILDSSISGDISYKTYTFKPNTQYTISTNTWVTSSSTANIFASAGTSFSPSSATNGVNGSRTITSDSNGKITIGYRNVNLSLDYSSGDYYVQIELGSKANSYTPYGTTPIELCKIGNYQDYIYKDSDKWYLHKEIGKVVYKGSEDGWTGNSPVTGVYRFLRTLNGAYNVGSSRNKNYIISNYFNGVTDNTIGGMYQYQTQIYFNMDSNSYSSVDSFKTWLSTHNTILYYVLSTPTNTEITYTELLNQLNELESS